MGRRRKYFSVEEQKQANREKVSRYYWNNKEECDKKARERYFTKKLAGSKNGTSGSVVPDEPQLLISQEQIQENEQ